MKKILSILLLIFILLIIVVVFLWINLGFFWNLYYGTLGNQHYKQGDYTQALTYHNKMVESDERYFALGNDYYRLDDYEKASSAFANIKNYQGLYNAGNAFFKFGDDLGSIDEKIVLWQQSVDFYTKSIEAHRTLRAEQNYNFVKAKLDELLKEQEQEQTQQQSDDETENSEENSESGEETQGEDEGESNQSEDQETSDDGETSQEDSDSITPQPRGEQYKLGQESSVPGLSQSEAEYLERYIENLKQLEKQNQRFFNKASEESFSRDAFDSFMNPFGSGDSDGEKDW